jgi:hypothetical protein
MVFRSSYLQRCAHWTTAVLLGCAAASHPAQAIERIKLQLANLDGSGWHAQQLELQVQLGRAHITAQITVKQASLDGVAEPVRDIVIECAEVQLQDERFACPQARIHGRFPVLGEQRLNAAMSYGRRNGAIAMQLQNIKLAKGQASLAVQLQDELWQAILNLKQADIAELLKLAQRFVPATQDLSATGQLDTALTAQGNGALPRSLKWQVQANKLNASNRAGTLASETLAFNTSGNAQHTNGEWQFNAELASSSGQAYAEPIFVDLTKHPVTVRARGNFLSDRSEVQLQQLDFQQQDVATVSAQGRIALGDATNRVPELQLQIAQLHFPGSFDTYVQPLLINTSFKSLATAGVAQGKLGIKNSRLDTLDLALNDLRVDDGGKTLRFDDVNGALHWRDEAPDDSSSAAITVPTSTLAWRSGSLLGLELGATQLQLELWGTNVRIAQPTRIPIFNGALAIDAFRVRKAGTPQIAFMLDADIEPINVAQLCKAFGWPEFGGELSGKISKLRLEQDVLTLGATLSAQVFAGEVAISDMRLEGALSQWPRFNADIKLNNLDLEQVTQAFSFGRITGRLSGEITRLSLFNWQPVTFDARLSTPTNDRSKHRISQRAVQNIGSIGGGSGGGVAAALQSGVLRFFDDFNYDKLGLSCRLDNEVCFMDGVAPAANGGYYLVKGQGLPRIDVIGNATRVDWPRLVAQLKAATESGAPVVR